MKKATKPRAIDIFCGVGGMSLGFEQAGFDVVGAFDVEQRCIDAYNANFPHAPGTCLDLSKAKGTDLLAASAERPDVLFGGPPCQGFSIGGKRNPADSRNLLIYHFARFVRELKPRYFVLENVSGLAMQHAAPVLKSFLRRVRLAGYKTVSPIQVLVATDFGVPQRRYRVFILGYQHGETPPMYPSRCGIRDDAGKEYFPTVWDAIGDLPKIGRYASLLDSDCFEGDLGRASHYAQIMRGEKSEGVDFANKRDASNRLTGCLRTRHSTSTISRFRSTPRGAQEPISRYYRLHPDRDAPTIRAGTDRDHGQHTAPRPIHPYAPRCITVREAARLQSFPDWFQFHNTRWHAFRQIGNSVPPRVAKVVAQNIVSSLLNTASDNRPERKRSLKRQS